MDAGNARAVLPQVLPQISERAATERPERIKSSQLTDSEDIGAIAGQLADLTHGVEEMKNQLERVRLQAETQQSRADTQQERIDLAARELAEVSDRLQAAARALRQSI
jgi:hypothetical protein